MNSGYDTNVFMNCPFDEEYKKILRAMVFSLCYAGMKPRSALESWDSSCTRIEKLYCIIEECKYAIHDILRVELDCDKHLPRFNMPFELGMFFGAKRFGAEKHKEKNCLVIERTRYEFQKYISDLSGNDPAFHNNDPKLAINEIRVWLSSLADKRSIPRSDILFERYKEYEGFLAKIENDQNNKDNEHFDPNNFKELVELKNTWIGECYQHAGSGLL